MNDFTKEELEDIINALRALSWKSKISEIVDKSLRDKVQSMIDNYCDHKNIGSVSDADYVSICVECKELTGWV